MNVNAPARVLLDDQALPSTETFTYLGSFLRQDGGTNRDSQSRLSKARNAVWSLNAQRPLPFLAALSDRMEVPTGTFKAD